MSDLLTLHQASQSRSLGQDYTYMALRQPHVEQAMIEVAGIGLVSRSARNASFNADRVLRGESSMLLRAVSSALPAGSVERVMVEQQCGVAAPAASTAQPDWVGTLIQGQQETTRAITVLADTLAKAFTPQCAPKRKAKAKRK